MAAAAVGTPLSGSPRTLQRRVIEAEELGLRFHTRQALSGISLEVGAGEIFGIVGSDGAGKTTLMQLFAAILDPSEGRCRVLGFDTVAQASDVTARIGYMSQGFTLYDRLTVEENLAFSARVRGVDGAAWERRRARLLGMAGLEPFRARRAESLSGGMRKKLSLCTNLIHEPPLLLLDELSLGVDPFSRRELWVILREYRSRGAGVVVSTPYLDEAALCDRVAVLHRGRVRAVGTPAALQEHAGGTVFEFTGAPSPPVQVQIASRPEVLGLRRASGRVRIQFRWPVDATTLGEGFPGGLRSLRSVAPSLEEAFVHLTGDEESGSAGSDALTVPASPVRVAGGATVQIEDVTCRFGEFTAVDGVSLEVARGEIFGFLGPNGAGKTTLIRALCGLVAPAGGEVRIAGVDVRRDHRSLRARIGYMSQRFSLYPDLSVTENLRFFAGVYGLRGPGRHEAIRWASETVGLAGLEEEWAARLSGAVRQRLALACALLHRPQVLFLDEPTSGVAPLARQRFWMLIENLAQAGTTVLVTTHYMEEAGYCHRLGLMHEGRLIASGTIEALHDAVPAADESMEDTFIAHIERARLRGRGAAA